MPFRQIPPNELVRRGRKVAVQTINASKRLLQNNETMVFETSSEEDNVARKVDVFAECFGEERLLEYYPTGLRVLGEEKLKNQAKVISLRDEKKIVALLDMIDGTDLVYRKMSNWCSALVFFDPQAKRILASVVGLPSGAFYCAGHEIAPCVVKVTSRADEAPRDQLNDEIPIHPNNRLRLKDAAVCFYGQKAENLLSILEKDCGLPEYLRKISLLPKKQRPPCRFYNLGGNPMICKVADGSVDAVFELVGQKPHDVVPGTFIARCAGAVVKDLDNNPLPLEEALLTPNVGELRYIVAATEGLYKELREQILKRPKRSAKAA